VIGVMASAEISPLFAAQQRQQEVGPVVLEI
jgi:hypothetical protein